MINKRLFFIWLGDCLPSYVDFAISSFKKINPTFDVQFIRFKLCQIKHIYLSRCCKNEIEKLLLRSIDIMLDDNNVAYRKMIDGQKIFYATYGKDIRAIQLLSDIFRFELINKYGGIYIDCDTFPIRPFDDDLLNKECFIVCRHYNNVGNRTVLLRDNYFFGSNSVKKITNSYDDIAVDLIQTIDKWWANIKFLQLKYKFMHKNITYGEWSLSKDFYIEHYCDGNWKSKNNVIRTPLCFLDNFLHK